MTTKVFTYTAYHLTTAVNTVSRQNNMTHSPEPVRYDVLFHCDVLWYEVHRCTLKTVLWFFRIALTELQTSGIIKCTVLTETFLIYIMLYLVIHKDMYLQRRRILNIGHLSSFYPSLRHWGAGIPKHTLYLPLMVLNTPHTKLKKKFEWLLSITLKEMFPNV